MNKKIIISFFASILAVTLFLFTGFITILNLQKVEMVKEQLSSYNLLISTYMEEDNIQDLKKFDTMADSLRITLISKEGYVLYDSIETLSGENLSDREEFIQAKEKGWGSYVGTSKTTGDNRIYYATLLENGTVLRSSVVSSAIQIGSEVNGYILGILVIVAVISYFLAYRISKYLMEPIKEMSYATERISKGEYSKRVTVRKDRELKGLATNFNFMAQRVEQIFIENEEKQNRLEAILKSMNSGVFAFDNDNKIIIMNRFCRELFGIQDDIIGKDIYDIKELKELLSAIDSDEDQVEVKLREPDEKIIRMKSAEIYGEKIFKVGTVVVLEDIKKKKKLEKMRSQFVANVSHELKTPLTSIKGFSETLRYVEDEETRNKFLNIINEESERLTRLINDILSLSSIEHTKVLRQEKIYMVKEMEKIFSLFYPGAKARNVELIYEEKEDLVIRGDRDQFKQMILNLTDNALKYTKENGTVTMALKQADDRAVITIKDTGVGIPKKHLDRIFERFYRVDKSRDRVMGGTGLGLAIVKHIVLSFDGTITVESEVQVGTTFTIRLPLY